MLRIIVLLTKIEMGVPRISQTATCQCKIADLSHKKHSEYINYMRIDQMIKGTNQNDIGVTIFQIRFPCHIHAYMNCLQRNPLGLSRHLFVPFRPSHPLICPCLHIYIQWHKPSMPSMMFKFFMRINVTSYICPEILWTMDFGTYYIFVMAKTR